MLNVLIWLVSSFVAYALSPSTYGNVISALWESGITWMLEPGFYDPSVIPSIRILSIVIILTSMITFTGGIIGYVASLFSTIIENARKGKGKLFIYDHILILNWNQKALELIIDYGFEDKTTNIVVLSNQDKEIIEKAIERKLYDHPSDILKKIRIVVRQGEVFSKSDLMDLNIEQAKTIIILSDEKSHHHNKKHDDILAMKTLMLISNLDIRPEQTILVEVKQQDTVRLIKNYIAKNTKLADQIITIIPDELMGRLIAQTILMPDLNAVYAELFSFKGSEFYTIDHAEARHFMEYHHQAIPIYAHQDFLYVLASDPKAIEAMRDQPLTSHKKLKIKDQSRYVDRHLVIFGKNSKLDYILDSLSLYEKENQTKVHVTMVDSNEADVIKEVTDRIEKIDTILILSEDYLNPRDYDADVLLTLLLTQEIAKKHEADIVIELLDPKHFDIAKSYNIRNTIISNEYVSRIMTQLSKNRKLYDLFEDLLTYDPMDSEEETYEVYAYKARDIFNMTLPITFDSVASFIYSCYVSGDESYIMIGLSKEGQLEIFNGDLDQPRRLIIEPDDVVITICK